MASPKAAQERFVQRVTSGAAQDQETASGYSSIWLRRCVTRRSSTFECRVWWRQLSFHLRLWYASHGIHPCRCQPAINVRPAGCSDVGLPVGPGAHRDRDTRQQGRAEVNQNLDKDIGSRGAQNQLERHTIRSIARHFPLYTRLSTRIYTRHPSLKHTVHLQSFSFANIRIS